MADLDAPPPLAAAWAPAPAAFLATPSFEPRADAAPGGQDLFRRRHERGKAGVVVYCVSLGAVAVGTAVALVGLGGALIDSSGTAAGLGLVGAGLMVGGGVGVIVGEVLIFEGGINAARAAGVDTTVGWVGVGLVVGALPATLLLAQIAPDLGYVGSVMGLGGLVCGAVQLAEAGKAGRDRDWISWHLAPTPRGIGIAGTF